MEKLLGTVKSRTTWTIVAMFVMNNLVDIKAILPAGWGSYLNLGLAFAAIYFRANPIQMMGQANAMMAVLPVERGMEYGHPHSDNGCCSSDGKCCR